MLLRGVLLAFLALAQADTWFQDVNFKPPRKQWALLVASSNGWLNYRHQADICHAYHVLRSNGIPAENIITMMYDDIANNTRNPNKGVIINRPGGPNVYEGVIKDYTGPEVNVKNVFNVLKGDKEAMKGIGSGRVIESGPDDHIFVNIVDHGSTGVLCFPNQEYMYAKDLADLLRNMRRDRRFAKMAIYLEACEGGSMFDNIIDDRINVFVTTASAPDESSYAHYCFTELNTCLGDLYSAVWMENVDKLKETWSDRFVTLFKQYRHTRTNVNKSHVMVYGDFRLGFDKLSNYIGDSGFAPKHLPLFNLKKETPSTKKQVSFPVMSRDVPLHVLRNRLIKSDDSSEKLEIANKLKQLSKNREFVDDTIDQIITRLAGEDSAAYLGMTYSRRTLSHDVFPCYKSVIEKFNSICYNTHLNPYLLNHFYKLANICFWNIPAEKVTFAFSEVCGDLHRNANEIV